MRAVAVGVLLIGVLWGTPLRSQTSDYTLSLASTSGSAGDTAAVPVLFDSTGDLVQGWSFGVCQSGPVSVAGVELGATSLAFNGGIGPNFDATDLVSGGWITGVVIDFLGFETLPPGDDYELHVATYDLEAEGLGELSFCETLDIQGVPVEIVIVVDGFSLFPLLEGAEIEVTPAGPEFSRGDMDGDGAFNGLLDGLYLLNFGFVPGSPAPPCLDAADFDDNGSVAPLVDGLLALSFQFAGGEPPAPPLICGQDPTDTDPLGCDDSPCP